MEQIKISDHYLQPWIGKPLTDLLFILSPPFLCLFAIILFPDLFQQEDGMTTMSWVLLVLLIDVAHVYSTLYRTYFDPVSYKERKALLLAIPFVGFIVGMLVYSMSPLMFWRILAYVAVFHFIRQQYGFVRIYSRREKQSESSRLIDTVTIYSTTIYPILYWHLSGPKNFNWFVEGDFIYADLPWLRSILGVVFFGILVLYLIKEISVITKTRHFNIPKNLVVLGTSLSWYFGIVYYNGDLTFTLLNVVSHGIPYMALIWLHGNKKYVKSQTSTRFLRLIYSRAGIVIFVALLIIFAFVEEGVWDLAVWREHSSIFGSTDDFRFSQTMLSIIVPLLALPQITHYILDGFIWKVRKGEY